MNQVSDAVAEKLNRDREEREIKDQKEKLQKAKRLHLDYLLKLNDLGLHENIVINYTPKGMFPTMQVITLEGEEKAKVRKDIERMIADLSGIQIVPSGIIGA